MSSSVIGSRVPDVRAAEKVTGKPVYTIDIQRPGMLIGRVVRSTIPRGRIVSIDTSKAASLPGVAAVVTGKDVPPIPISATFPPSYDLRMLAGAADDMVRFVGDEVAAVAAADAETADRAVSLVSVTYEPLRSNSDAATTTDPGAPAVESPWFPGNVMAPYAPMVISRGDVAGGLAEADVVFTGSYDMPSQASASLRPYSCLAEWSGDQLTIYNDTQVMYTRQGELAQLFQIPTSNIKVVSQPLAGGFGEDNVYRFIPLAAFLARKTGKPVKMVMPQDFAFEATPNKRHPASATVSIGAKADGTMTAIDLTITYDKGAYLAGGFSVPYVGARGVFNAYRTPNMRYTTYAVFTDNPPAGALRGYGGVQSNFAVQSAMDDLAAKLSMDPTDLHALNCIRPDDVLNIQGEIVDFSQVGGAAFRQAISEGKAASGWASKWAPFGGLSGAGRVVKGIGVALLTYGFGHIPDTSSAQVAIGQDGAVQITMGTADLGGGQPTTMSMIVAQELGAALDDVSIAMGETDYPPAPFQGTFGSRTTFIAGNGAKAAAADARQQLLAAAATAMGTEPSNLLTQGSSVSRADNGQSMSFADVVKTVLGGSIVGTGQYVQTLYVSRTGFQFGACFAEVEVDRWTGKVTPTNLTMVQDYGKAINPLAVEGQMQGAALQGIGYGLLEDYVVDQASLQPLSRDWLYYKVPTMMDVPPMSAIVLENPDPRGPFGAKGGGESMIICTHSAIRNAVANAIGVRFTTVPITPKMVIDALKGGG
ncbi:MAG: xanthine dehydrogenase family protein molybdopterin-binding subunit [Nitrososphaerota archaeon]|nr:xanthine dehydrogenase family protein molybdopterin-binding subunit [Nitrososphaerota archaeon]